MDSGAPPRRPRVRRGLPASRAGPPAAGARSGPPHSRVPLFPTEGEATGGGTKRQGGEDSPTRRRAATGISRDGASSPVADPGEGARMPRSRSRGRGRPRGPLPCRRRSGTSCPWRIRERDLQDVAPVRFGRIDRRDLRRCAASTFSFTPPIGRTSPRRVISPVIATSRRTGRFVNAEIMAVAIVMPAEGPSLGIAPSGTWTCRSCVSKRSPGCRARRRARARRTARPAPTPS